MSTNVAAVPAVAVARATWKDYLALTKPRVISLLLFTTLAAMFIAQKGWPGFTLFAAVAIAGYMSAGAANAINMVIDRDIDERMKRTTRRPVVTKLISSRDAMIFGIVMETVSFALFWGFANLLAAALSLAGLLFYVFIYTLYLKRRTPQNIVIGGAAGCFPPLVGWAAVTNDLSLLAWFMFGLIFVWTPVHFWALAILIKEDYSRAGVPMMPCVRGDQSTSSQILGYALITAALSFAPLAMSQSGWIYIAAAVVLNVILLLRAMQLKLQTERPRAVKLYLYSMLYLALLFLALAVDRMVLA
jgi:protoheme IX farnesyltransferase